MRILLLLIACLCCLAYAQNHSCVQADNVVFTGEVETVCNISSFNNLAVFLCNMTGEEQALVGCPPGGPYTSLKQPFWIDADGDGYGASNCNSTNCSQIFACTLPAGYSRNNLDCDDTNPLIFPGSVLCKTGTADTYNLQTLWPPVYNFSFPSSQCRQSSPNVTQWGAGLSLHNNLLFMGSICGTVGLVWHFDSIGQFWVVERNFSFTPQNQPDAIDFAHSASLWDPYLAITMGHSEILLPNTLYFWFDLWQRLADSSWTRISITSLNSQLRSEGIAGNFYLANGRTVGGGAGPGALIPGGNANDSVAALGKIVAGVYTETTLCNCTISPSFPCPVGWNAHIGGVNLCKNSNQNWGHVSAIDRFDGKYAVVVYDPSLFPQPTFEFFQFNTTDGLWYWVYEVITVQTITVDNLSVGMYNGLVAFGNRVGSATTAVPPIQVDGVNCNGVDIGWTRFMTLGGTPTAPTWTLSSAYLVDPNACTGNFCGETVAVGSNNRILVGCPEYLMPVGRSFGKALVFDVSNPSYPNLVAKYVAPLGQRGLGNADVGFATFIDMDDSRIAFATDFVATQGFSSIGRGWITRCANESTCPVPVVAAP